MSARLTIAVGDYDHTRDLTDGRVAVPGLDIHWTAISSPEEMFGRFLDGGEFDGAELSMAVCSILCARGDDRFVPIPVFPARSFRHGAIYVAADGPTSPGELSGATIGIPVWAQTAGVYVRGILASHHGLALESIRWIQAGVDTPGRREPVDVDFGRFDVRSEPQRSLDELLLAGEVDAVISARPPACVERGDPRVRRLFADPMAEEISYFRATGIFPIMHVLALRRDSVTDHRLTSERLLGACEEAKRRSLARVAATTVPGVPLPWAATHAGQARGLIGDDWWPYGLEANRRTLDAFLGFAAEQQLTARRLAPEDLFAASLTTP
jgi:4,5-dihydroxyphthalate decarboxylase